MASYPQLTRVDAGYWKPYENEIQEAMNGLHSGRFKSIWAVATALGVSLFSNIATHKIG